MSDHVMKGGKDDDLDALVLDEGQLAHERARLLAEGVSVAELDAIEQEVKNFVPTPDALAEAKAFLGFLFPKA